MFRDCLVVKLQEDIITDEKRLVDIYKDQDESRHNELAVISANSVLRFYDRLKEIKEYHKKYPEKRGDAPTPPMELARKCSMFCWSLPLSICLRLHCTQTTHHFLVKRSLANMLTCTLFMKGERIVLFCVYVLFFFVSLHSSACRYNNMKNVFKRLDYYAYLGSFMKYSKVPRHLKGQPFKE